MYRNQPIYKLCVCSKTTSLSIKCKTQISTAKNVSKLQMAKIVSTIVALSACARPSSKSEEMQVIELKQGTK